MRNTIILILLLFGTFKVLAHEDTPIILTSDGKLEGLPERFSPTLFDRTTFTLTIGQNSMAIPNCVKEMCNYNDSCNIAFTASWYHEHETLPDYLVLNIIPQNDSLGYNIHFYLETLEIFEIWNPKITRIKDKEYVFDPRVIAIAEECQEEITRSIIKK